MPLDFSQQEDLARLLGRVECRLAVPGEFKPEASDPSLTALGDPQAEDRLILRRPISKRFEIGIVADHPPKGTDWVH